MARAALLPAGRLSSDGQENFLAPEQVGIEDGDRGAALVLGRLDGEVPPLLVDRGEHLYLLDPLQTERAGRQGDGRSLAQIERLVEADSLHVLEPLQRRAEHAALLELVGVGG